MLPPICIAHGLAGCVLAGMETKARFLCYPGPFWSSISSLLLCAHCQPLLWPLHQQLYPSILLWQSYPSLYKLIPAPSSLSSILECRLAVTITQLQHSSGGVAGSDSMPSSSVAHSLNMFFQPKYQCCPTVTSSKARIEPRAKQ